MFVTSIFTSQFKRKFHHLASHVLSVKTSFIDDTRHDVCIIIKHIYTIVYFSLSFCAFQDMCEHSAIVKSARHCQLNLTKNVKVYISLIFQEKSRNSS